MLPYSYSLQDVKDLPYALLLVLLQAGAGHGDVAPSEVEAKNRSTVVNELYCQCDCFIEKSF